MQVKKYSQVAKKLQRSLETAAPPIRFAIKIAILGKSIFGSKFRLIPLAGKADGLISGLLELQSSEYPPVDVSPENYFCEWGTLNTADLDLIVAGSGPGGSITALRAAQSGSRVLVVEKGGILRNDIPHHSAEQMKHHFKFGGQEIVLGNSIVPFAQGQAWGGGSQINSGLYHRLPSNVAEVWMGKVPSFSDSARQKAELLVEDEIKVDLQTKEHLGIYGQSPLRRIGEYLGWDGGVVRRWRKYLPKGGYLHFGMSETYLSKAFDLGVQRLLMHEVIKFQASKSGVEVVIVGKKCQHKVSSKSLCISAGVVGTPEILHRSKIVRLRDFKFGFHAMYREVAKFEEEVNDLTDIDPHQFWNGDNSMKIGAAVGTPSLLKSTLASKKISTSAPLEKLASYYISVPATGNGGILKIGRTYLPFFIQDKKMKSLSLAAVQQLRSAINAVGGNVLGELNASATSVHVFGSLPLGGNKVTDTDGFIIGSWNRVFVRDASILPSPPMVNPQGPLMHLVEVLEAKRLGLTKSDRGMVNESQ